MPAVAARRVVLAIFFLCGSFIGLWASRIPDFKTQTGLDEAGFGLLLLVVASGSFVAFPYVGALVDRVGAATVSKVLSTATIISFGLVGFAPNMELLVAALFLAGFSFGGLDVAMNGWGAEVEKNLGRPVMSSFHGFFSLGAGVGAQLGGFAIWGGLSIPAHFSLWCLAMVPLAVWAYSQPWPKAEQVPDAGTKAPLFAIPKGALILAGCVALVAALGEGAITDWAALYQIDDLGYPESLAPTAFTIFSIAMVIMRLAGDQIIARFGPVKVAQISGVAAFVGCLLLVSGANIWMVWVGCFVMGLGYAVLFPLAMSRAANDPDMSPGKALAAVVTLGYGSFLLGPPLLGFVGEAWSLRVSFGAVAVMTLAIPFLATSLKVKT
ncbi:MAG: MFS transporter [Roseibium sp.]